MTQEEWNQFLRNWEADREQWRAKMRAFDEEAARRREEDRRQSEEEWRQMRAWTRQQRRECIRLWREAQATKASLDASLQAFIESRRKGGDNSAE